MRKDYKLGWFEAAEDELERQMLEIRRDLTVELIGAHDIDAPAIEIDGTPHRRVLRAAQTYMTAAGPVTAERWLYRERDDDSQPAMSPVELRLGIVDFWSPKAAKQALWLVARDDAADALGHRRAGDPHAPRMGPERPLPRGLDATRRALLR